MSQGKEETLKVPSVIVHKYEKTLTGDAKWLQIDKPMLKLYRPNFYDIGGTYLHDLLGFWFTFSTEIVGDIILLHLFVCNYLVNNFTVSSSLCHQELTVDSKKQTVHLTHALENHTFVAKKGTLNYVTTYSFNELDVQAFDSKTLFIAINLSPCNISQLDMILKERSYKALKKVSLSHDCGELLKEPYNVDFVIVSESGEEIPAHKLILSTHSTVFKAMFNEDNQNLLVQEDRIVENCTSKEIYDFLEFLYTGTIAELEICNIHTMLILADKYLVQGLKDFAVNVLLLDISIENCFEMLNYADMFNSEKFKYAAMKFIKQNAQRLEFKNLDKHFVNKKLIYEITDYVVVRDSI